MISNKEIRITSTGVQIVPYHKNQCLRLEKLTSIYDGIRHRRNPITGFFLDYESTELCFVTHMHSPSFLQDLFPDYTIVYTPRSYGYQLTEQYALNPDIEPREVQSELINQIITDNKHNDWFIYLSQGLGKTLLSVYLISYFNVRTIIMCYNKEILQQWYATMRDKTSINPNKILMVDSSKVFSKILDGTFPAYEYDIFLCTPLLLSSFGKKYGFHNLQKLFDLMHIGFKIFDEAHRNIANIIKINAFTSVNRTLYLSGDFGQSNKAKEQLYFNIFRKIPILTPSDDLMNTLKFTVAIVIKYNSHPSELEKASCMTRRGFSFYEFMKYQFQTDIFFDRLYDVLGNILNTNTNHYRILILVNLIEHVDELYDELRKKYMGILTVGRYHSKVEPEEKEVCKNQCDLIVSTYQSFSTGIDVSKVKYVISCANCTKIDDNQSSGRARPLPDNSDAYYFMFADVGFGYTKKTLGKRLRYLQETKIKDIQVIDYTDGDA